MVLERLPTGLLVAGLACVISAAAAGSIAYGFGFRYAEALGNSDLQSFKATQAVQAGAAEKENRLQLLQQVTCANEAEALLLTTLDRHAEEKRQLQERIPMSRPNTFRRLALSLSLSLVACSLLAGCATSTPPLVCRPRTGHRCHHS